MQCNRLLDRSLLPCRVSVVILVAVFGICIYRAATQSLTIDESTTFNLYVKDAPPALFALDSYRANHHVLNSLLAWLSLGLFGFSELSLRLPALLGGLLFLVGSYRVLLLVMQSTWRLPLACLGLWLNPIVLDHLVKARGYGMALGFATVALLGLLRWLPNERRSVPQVVCVSVLLGLSVASNLVFAVWAVALVAAASFLSRTGGVRWGMRHYLAACLPGAAFASAIVAVPLSKMQNLRFGATTWRGSLGSLVDSSLHHGSEPCAEPKLFMVGMAFLSLVTLGSLVVWARGSSQRKQPAILAIRLLSASIVVACAIYVVARLFSGELRLPSGRTGLFLIVGLQLLMVALAAQRAVKGRLATALGRLLTVLLFLLVVSHVREFTLTRFRSGGHDASARAVFDRLHELHQESGTDDPLSVGIFGWFYDSTLNAYREMESATWLAPVRREKIPSQGHDFVVVADEVWHLAKEHCIVIKRYPQSQTRLVRYRR